MNLLNGQINYDQIDEKTIANIKADIIDTLLDESLDVFKVIDACDNIVSRFDIRNFTDTISQFGVSNELAELYLNQLKANFNRNALIYRLHREFGDTLFTKNEVLKNVYEQVQPLGVILHIPAGNADALPVFSVFEGLLCGNINILKLPSDIDNCLSIKILQLLIEEYPLLSKYVYVFDYSSKDIFTMKSLINIAHGVVVWGGSEAISAIRSITPPEIKLIEWGHKISFAYFTKKGITKKNLEIAAHNIAKTNQLLCSSCQGIYIDTDDINDIYNLCNDFIPILDSISLKYDNNISIGVSAQITLLKITEKYSQQKNKSKLFQGKNVSIIAYKDSNLTDSLKYRNLWIKPLLKKDILKILYPYKSLLQTVFLAGDINETENLSNLFLKSGLTRISIHNDMSDSYLAEPHDGEFSLRRYTKITSIF